MSKQKSEEIAKPKRSDLLKVDPRSLKTQEGFNARVDYGDIDALKNSIVENGVQKPLKVRKDEQGNFGVIDGHRRMTAIQKALEEGAEVGLVPVVTADKHSNEEDDIFDIFIQNDGKPLSDLEKGEVFKRLTQKGYEVNEIAKRVGISQAKVSQVLKLAAAPKKVKDHVKAGRIAPSTVIQLLQKQSEEKAVEKIEEAVKGVEKEEEKEKESESKGASKSKGSSKKGGKKKRATKKDVTGEKTLDEVVGDLQEKAKDSDSVDKEKMKLLTKLRRGVKEGKGADELFHLVESDKKSTVEKKGSAKKDEKKLVDPNRDGSSEGGPIT